MLIIILSFLFTYFLTYLIIPLLKRFFLVVPNNRSSHSIAKPTAGGIVFVSLISFTGCFINHYIPLICLPLSIVSLIDDKYDLKPNFRLLIQIMTIISLIIISPLNKILLDYFDNIIYLILLFGLIFLSLACINFINFADGLDGLLAGCMVIIFTTISIYLGLNFWIYIASLIGFLFLNWYPSKLFMGDVGSIFLGSLFLGTIFQTNNFTDAFKLLLLASPLLGDALISVTRRLLSGESIVIPHKSFYFQRLNQGKLSHSQVSTIYMTATTLICVCLLFGNLYWMVGTIFLEFILLLFLEDKFAIKL